MDLDVRKHEKKNSKIRLRKAEERSQHTNNVVPMFVVEHTALKTEKRKMMGAYYFSSGFGDTIPQNAKTSM